ncbi:hypothetical protein DFH06DRAFT_1446058 [Mycena polygramma]|nr:hypothetical protein DFH06DRAFT_1446058 [Mycena polygramma]
MPLYDSQWPEEDDYEPAMTLSYPADFSDATDREDSRCPSRDESWGADFATVEDSKAWRREQCYIVDADNEGSPAYGSDSGSFTVSCSYTAAQKCKQAATNRRGTQPQAQRRAVAKAVKRTSPPLSLPLLPPIKQKKKSAHTKAQRRAILEADYWADSVTPHSVVCRGCEKTIQMDARNEYYPGLWLKHRDKRCEGVKLWRAQEQRARIVNEEMSDFVEAEAGTSARLTPPVSCKLLQADNVAKPDVVVRLQKIIGTGSSIPSIRDLRAIWLQENDAYRLGGTDNLPPFSLKHPISGPEVENKVGTTHLGENLATATLQSWDIRDAFSRSVEAKQNRTRGGVVFLALVTEIMIYGLGKFRPELPDSKCDGTKAFKPQSQKLEHQKLAWVRTSGSRVARVGTRERVGATAELTAADHSGS